MKYNINVAKKIKFSFDLISYFIEVKKIKSDYFMYPHH